MIFNISTPTGFQLATSQANALDGTEVDITDTGTGSNDKFNLKIKVQPEICDYGVQGNNLDIKIKKPILGNKFGGLSGPCIKPIAVRCVYDIYETVDIPIIGIGGILDGNDAIEMMMAGASAIGIGTGVLYRGIDIFKKISNEIENFMKENNYKKLEELIGIAH